MGAVKMSRVVASVRWLLGPVVFMTAACADHAVPRPSSRTSCAVDLDGDRYGLGCPLGDDCNDQDPSVQTDCEPCSQPAEGCECATDSEPVRCSTQSLVDSDTILCKTGMRYCRDQQWTACEGVVSFEAEVPESAPGKGLNALLGTPDPDDCGPCAPNCYPVVDTLDTVDGGLTDDNSTNVAWAPGGAITLESTSTTQIITPTTDCIPGTCDDPDPKICDSDCDGVADEWDIAVQNKPFGTTIQQIFLQIAPGETENAVIDLDFYLRTADVYFLLDSSSTMADELSDLVDDMTTGEFLVDDRDCADTDRDGLPNNELMNEGIAGNITCRARNAHLGTGWVREIPFGDESIDAMSMLVEPGSATTGMSYGDFNEFLFEHRADLDADPTFVQDALVEFAAETADIIPPLPHPDAEQGSANYEGPNGQIQGLSFAATGVGSYVGWDRPAIPDRVACGLATWGYPCFRNEAFPIIVMISDEPMYNGPIKDVDNVSLGSLGSAQGNMSVPFNYPSDILTGTLHAGTAHDPIVDSNGDGTPDDPTDTYSPPQYYTVSPNHNETLTSPWDVGVINDKLVTYTGDTRDMSADIPATVLSCFSAQNAAGPDAVFYFTVEEQYDSMGALLPPKELIISTQGSRFTSLAGVFKEEYDPGSSGSTTFTTNYSSTPGAGDSVSSPAEINDQNGDGVGEALPSGVDATVTGGIVATDGDLPREIAGIECYDGSSESNPGANKSTDYGHDQLFRFTLSQPLDLKFWVRPDENQSMVSLTLFDGKPNPPETLEIPSGVSRYALPDVINNNAYRLILAGDPDGDGMPDDVLKTSTMSQSVSGTPFIQKGCTEVATGAARGFTIDFQVNQANTDVAIETNGDGVGLDVVVDGNGNSQVFHAIGAYSRASFSAPTISTPVNADCESGADGTNPLCQVSTSSFPNGWYQLTGSIGSFDENIDPSWLNTGTCGLNAQGRDVVYRIDVAGTVNKTLEFNTDGSSIPTYMSLHGSPMSPTAETKAVTGESYTLGTSSIIDSRKVTFDGTTASKSQTVKNSDFGFQSNGSTRCMPGGTSAKYNDVYHVFTTTDAQTVTIDLEANGLAYDPAFALYKTTSASGVSATNIVKATNTASCGEESDSAFTYNLAANSTYYLVVSHGGASTTSDTSGAYKLTVDAALNGNVLDCSHISSTNTSSLTKELAPGSYFLVVKAEADGDVGNFELNILDRSSEAAPSLKGCVQCTSATEEDCIVGNTGGTKVATRLILEDLPIGGYTAVIRPTDTNDVMDMRVTIRDLSHTPLVVTDENGDEACHNTKGSEHTQSFIVNDLPDKDENGVTIEYYLLLRGFNYDDGGDFDLHVQDLDPAVPQPSSSWCEGQLGENGEIRAALPYGDYYAVVKGLTAEDKGWYQVTFGDPSLATAEDYTPMSWYGPGGANGDGTGSVRSQLLDRDIHVIGINTGTNEVLTKQLEVIATDTEATHPNGEPLVIQSSDPTGLSNSVVQMVEQLSFAMEMDVNIVLVKAPDNPNGEADDFDFYVEAIDTPDDGCAGIEDNQVEVGWPVDVQGTPDTHTGCVAGALPPFRVYFHNPEDFPVPCNGLDSNGNCIGYEMRVDLIGNGTYVIDQVPVYIIPENVTEEEDTAIYDPVGAYWQDFTAANCVAPEAPDWSDLEWSAWIPEDGAELKFSVCTADTAAGLENCNYTNVVTITSDGTTCSMNSQCPNGMCRNGQCQFPVGKLCDEDGDCGNGECGPANQCIWTSLPIDVGLMLPAGKNNLSNMRVKVGLEATDQLDDAPVLYDWTVRYWCESRE
jgi:hypothetical protein